MIRYIIKCFRLSAFCYIYMYSFSLVPTSIFYKMKNLYVIDSKFNAEL